MDTQELKQKNNKIIPILVAGLVALSLAVVYFVMKQTSEPKEVIGIVNETQTGQVGATQPATSEAVTTEPAIVVTQTQTEEEITEIDHTGDIDKDLNSLDSLDLSTAENDLGDDKISDL